MAQQVLVNLESYLDHRTKLNEMMEETYHLESGGASIYCDGEFTPAAGSVSNGSQSSPFNDLSDAFNAIVPINGIAQVLISVGEYVIPGLGVDIPQNISLINQGTAGDARIFADIRTENSNAILDGLFLGEPGSGDLLIIGLNDTPGTVENFSMKDCTIASGSSFFGGDSLTDIFQYNSCIFLGSAQFISESHFITGCTFISGCSVGTPSSGAITDTDLSIFSSCIFQGSFNINNFGGAPKTISLTMFDCTFATTFNISVSGTINITMDLPTYESALNVGANLDQANVNLVVLGRSKYQFSDVVIPVGGLIPIAANDPPLDADYTDVCTLSADVVDGEIYVVTVNFIKFLADLNDGLYWRFTGDFPSDVFFVEAKDLEDRIPFAYSFPITTSGTTFTLTLEAATEEGANSEAQITDANITIERKF